MQNESIIILRILGGLIFIASLCVGYYLLKNHRKLFGFDADMPSEGLSSQTYSQMMIYSVWALVLVGSGSAALFYY